MLLGFPEWLRGPASIVGGEVVLDEERAEPYTPYDMDRAIFALAALRQQEDNIGAFVRRYGLLRRGPELFGTGTCREPVSEWRDAIEGAWAAVHLYRTSRSRQNWFCGSGACSGHKLDAGSGDLDRQRIPRGAEHSSG